MRKKIYITFLIFICIFAFITQRISSTSYVDINNQEQIISLIKKRTGHNTITIQATKFKENIYVVLYKSEEDEICLFLFEKASFPFNNLYTYFGKASSTATLNTYNYHNYETNTSLIIVYGDSPKEDAASYSLEVNNILYRENITDDKILDIFIIKDSKSSLSISTLYDSFGEIIGRF